MLYCTSNLSTQPSGDAKCELSLSLLTNLMSAFGHPSEPPCTLCSRRMYTKYHVQQNNPVVIYLFLRFPTLW
jgi:hypothetical protein